MLIRSLHHLRRAGGAVISLQLAFAAIGCTPADRVYAAGAAGGQVPSFAPVVHEVMPAVVNVSALQKPGAVANRGEEDGPFTGNRAALRGLPPSVLNEILRRFLNKPDRGSIPGQTAASVAVGSGFIIDPSGYVATDDHVVENAEKVTIVVQDTTAYPARIVGRDPITDLALLKIEAGHPLSAIRWGDSDGARVGDWVLAIGNPFGLDNTVSSGIISGRGRDLHSGPYDDFMQIDAAMNRGNSGGPTFDLHGNVIGINTAIYSPNGGSVGIGFAIPANRARPVLEQLKEHGRVARGCLGIQIERVTPELVQLLGLPRAAGALVARVGASTPAATAGFEQGDVIVSINGRDITRMRDVPRVIAEMPIGRTAAVTIWRHNALLSLQPVISEVPANADIAEPRKGERQNRQPERSATAPVPMAASSPMI